jgi:hypothetical protein
VWSDYFRPAEIGFLNLGGISSIDTDELSCRRYCNRLPEFDSGKEKAASPGDVKKARLLEIIGNEYTAMREAEKNKREAVFDHDIAKIRTQMFRDLIEWQKMVPESKPVNASGRNRPRKKKTKPREKLMLLP